MHSVNIYLSQQVVNEIVAAGQQGANTISLELPVQQLLAKLRASSTTAQPVQNSTLQIDSSTPRHRVSQEALDQTLCHEQRASQSSSSSAAQLDELSPSHNSSSSSISIESEEPGPSKHCLLQITDTFRDLLLTKAMVAKMYQPVTMPSTAELQDAEQELQ